MLMNYALMLLARTFSIYDEIASRNYINERMVSLKDKKYDTLKEVKTTENINKKSQSFQGKSHIQNENSPLRTLQKNAHE